MEKKTKLASGSMVYRYSPEVISRVNSDKSLSILHLGQYNCYYCLDGVALEFWKMIDGKKSVAHLVDKLQRKYPAHAKQIPTKVSGWIRDFKKYKLLAC